VTGRYCAAHYTRLRDYGALSEDLPVPAPLCALKRAAAEMGVK